MLMLSKTNFPEFTISIRLCRYVDDLGESGTDKDFLKKLGLHCRGPSREIRKACCTLSTTLAIIIIIIIIIIFIIIFIFIIIIIVMVIVIFIIIII